MNFQEIWSRAISYESFVAASTEHCRMWEGLYAISRVPPWALEVVPDGAGVKLLAIVEDWCGDASNTIPVVARFAATAPGVELRVLRRDEHPEVMDRYLTNGSRSIPIVIVLDGDFRELGRWGPRPRELQAWVMENKSTMPRSELYPKIRQWYARDRGESTLREVLQLVRDEGRGNRE